MINLGCGPYQILELATQGERSLKASGERTQKWPVFPGRGLWASFLKGSVPRAPHTAAPVVLFFLGKIFPTTFPTGFPKEHLYT